MADNELESFLFKFKSLSVAGFKASFNAEAVDGAVSVTLKADIGRLCIRLSRLENIEVQHIGDARSAVDNP